VGRKEGDGKGNRLLILKLCNTAVPRHKSEAKWKWLKFSGQGKVKLQCKSMAGYRDPPLHKLQLIQKMESKTVQSVGFKLLLWPLSATAHLWLTLTLSPNRLLNRILKAVGIQTRLSPITTHLTFLFSIIDTHCLAFSKNSDLMVSVSCDTECPMSRMITIASCKKKNSYMYW